MRRRRLRVTVSKAFLEKLEKARASLSHSHPGASAEAILEAGLDLLLAKDAKRKAQSTRPKAEPRPCKPETVPAHVRREVWKRDADRCQWKLDSGATVRAPTLVVSGDGDTVLVEHAVEIFRTLPDAQLCVLPGTGHNTFVPRAAWLLPMLTSFLDAPDKAPK